MLELIIFSLFALVYIALLYIVVALRPMPISAALSIAFAFIIGLESVLLNFLSTFQFVTRNSILISHLVILFSLGLLGILKGKLSKFRHFVARLAHSLHRCISHPAYLYLAPYLLMLVLAILVNAPNTWDSLTYHLARVAHWINNGSVDYYFTSINRQNEMNPGAEYLILFFQILTNTDILSGVPQLLSFLFLPGPLYYIFRVVKIPASLIPYFILLTVSTPMAVLQATTTQNDLVCSLLTLSIIVSSLRLFYGNLSRLRTSDYWLFGLCLGAGYLVKPTSLLVVAPFLLVGALIQISNLKLTWQIVRQISKGLAVTILTVTATAGPDIYRKIIHLVSRNEVYPLFSEWTAQRIINPISTLAQNMPWPDAFISFLHGMGYSGQLFTRQIFNNHSDYIGSPVQLLLLLLFSLITLILSPFCFKKDKRLLTTLLLSFCPIFAWVIFALIVRNQPWIARLQLPILLISPLSLLYVTSLAKENGLVLKYFRMSAVTVVLFSLTYTFVASINSQERFFDLRTFWGSKIRKISYDYDRHNAFMREAENQNCKRIGLIIGNNSPDYPLTWRARERGMITRHIQSDMDDDWSCLVYVEMGDTKQLEPKNSNWIHKNENTWYRDLEFEFKQSDDFCFDMSSSDQLMELQTLPTNDLKKHKAPDGVLLSTEGNDPALLLPTLFQCTTTRSAILELIVQSDETSDVQLFYRKESTQPFTEMLSMTRKIEKGKNIIYFFLPIDEIQGPVRLDIGRKPGDYLVSSIRCKTIAAAH